MSDNPFAGHFSHSGRQADPVKDPYPDEGPSAKLRIVGSRVLAPKFDRVWSRFASCPSANPLRFPWPAATKLEQRCIAVPLFI